MNIRGRLHRITDPQAFANSWLTTNGKPKVGYSDWSNARVHLATDMPLGQFSGGFLPSMSFKTDTAANGSFSFNLGNNLGSFRGQLLAYDVANTALFPGFPPIPMLDVVYRSQPFKFADVSTAEQAEVQDVFVFKATAPTNAGVSQDELNSELAALKQAQKLNKLRAVISADKISVSAEKSGGVVKFSCHVRGSTSADLEQVIDVKAGEIDIDLPGPDFITGLCVDKDDIESQIRKGLSKLSLKVSQELVSELKKKLPGIVSLASVSVWRTRHVQIGTKKVFDFPGPVPDLTVPVFAVVPDPAFGVPKKLY